MSAAWYRRKLVVALLFLALGCAGVAYYVAFPPPEPDVLVTLERFEQRSRCNGDRVSVHALVGLRPVFDISVKNALAGIEIRSNGRLLITAEVDGSDIRFPTLFGKPVHSEQWRPFCEMGRCRAKLLVYTTELGVSPGLHDFDLLFKNVEGAEIGRAVFRDVPVPEPDAAAAADYVPIEVWIEADRLIARTRLDGAGVATFLFQVEDAAGRWERVIGVGAASGNIEQAVIFDGTVQYAAGLIYVTNEAEGWSQENKIELIRAGDPFFDCP